MKTKTLRGFRDILPDEIFVWHYVEDKARNVLKKFGFSEIRVPVLEYTELFTRSLGSTTDIVEKEMYTFDDRDGSSVTLRPEGTASVVRSYIDNALHLKSPVTKFYYMGPMFRHERPQKGRYRNFHQIGVELFGPEEPEYDAEIINMVRCIFEDLDILHHITIEISSLGDARCRPAYRTNLIKYFTEHKSELCDECNKRLYLNPLRILDCKNEECRNIADEAPSILDYLCNECEIHFNQVTRCLKSLDIRHIVNPKIVRGLDYYNRTVFELTTDKLGSQNAVAAGGRYDGLVKDLGGPDIPAIGFAAGMERLVLLIQETTSRNFTYNPDIYITYMNKSHAEFAFKITQQLRKNGLVIETDYNDKSLKSKLKRANKSGAGYTIIIGENEFLKDELILKNMESGTEKLISIKEASDLNHSCLDKLF